MRALVIAVLVGAGGVACSDSGVVNPVDASSPPSTDAASGPVLPKPSSNDPAVQKGWMAALARGCATCHEPANTAFGVLSGQTEPVPGTTSYGSNLTPDPDTGMDAWDAASIANALRKGVDDQDLPLCPAMPVYMDMNDDEANSIASYLQSLAAVHRAIPSSVCPPLKVADAGADVAPVDAAGGG
jgi:cytochrome c1